MYIKPSKHATPNNKIYIRLLFRPLVLLQKGHAKGGRSEIRVGRKNNNNHLLLAASTTLWPAVCTTEGFF